MQALGAVTRAYPYCPPNLGQDENQFLSLSTIRQGPPLRRITTLVADDHPAMLSALVRVLEEDRRFVVVGTATEGDETMVRAEALRPDLVLLDVNMPCGGSALARLLGALNPAPAVVAISAQSASSTVEDMVRAGAVGFVTKGRVGDGLGDLLVRCAEGEVVLASSTAATALRSVLRSPVRTP